FSAKVKVPQIGWNQITDLKTSLFKGIPEKEHIYLVHSYYAPICYETIAVSEYDVPYSAALQKNNFYGTQFHPEKSSMIGEAILKNFLEVI
ncbi:MAG: glutamine amidotransferase-related protein, partial [Flavobacteriales bacterium]